MFQTCRADKSSQSDGTLFPRDPDGVVHPWDPGRRRSSSFPVEPPAVSAPSQTGCPSPSWTRPGTVTACRFESSAWSKN